jgi:Protein of unknown function (DUF2804)
MPLLRRGRIRKRWRYIGVYGPELMLCAARAQIGPLWQSFWVVWDRREGRRYADTSSRPGSRQVAMEGSLLRLDAGEAVAELRLDEAAPVESLCPSGERGYGWTRKRAGIPVRGSLEVGGRRLAVDGLGVDDESAGYHARRVNWHWSAGVGRAVDGRALAWNLVVGINDPPRRSERAIWVEGAPGEPAPVTFDGLEGIEFERGGRLRFSAESERARSDNFILVRSRYSHRFGTFGGSLDGIELAEGFGVMERHEAVW